MKTQAAVLLVASLSIAVSTSLALAEAVGAALSQEPGAGMAAPISPPTVDAAGVEWKRVAVRIGQSGDLGAIIQMHRDFLAKYPDAVIAKDVGESLASYQKLAEGDGVKYHGKWMTGEQLDTVLTEGAEAARPVLEAYLGGRIKEALDGATALLAKDGQNANVLTIAGLAAYRSGNVGLARKYFGGIAETDPTYVLAQNNLAVIGSQQKQVSEVLLHYTKALGVWRDELQVLDNVAEAMNSYKVAGGNMGTGNFKAMAEAYAKVEAAAELKMGKFGVRRSGAGWVTQEQFDAMAKNRQTLKDQMSLLDAQYKATQSAIAEMDATIQGLDARAVNAANISPVAVERVNWDRGKAQGQRDVLAGRLADLSGQYATVKSQLAAAENGYTGEQVIMDIEAAPSDAGGAPTVTAPVVGDVPAVTAGAGPTPVAPVVGAQVAGRTVSTQEPDEEPPMDHGGVYNPVSVQEGGRPHSPPATRPAVHVDHCVPRSKLFSNGKPVDISKLGPPGSEIEARGNLLYTPEGVITLDDDDVDFSAEHGEWVIGKDGKVVYHNIPLPDARQNALPYGPWTLNQNGQVVRQSQLPPAGGRWVLDDHGRAVRQ